MEYYRKIDLLVLTSISEAQPLVILEANCAGIPVVASDVGSCRELIEGRTHNDRLIGPFRDRHSGGRPGRHGQGHRQHPVRPRPEDANGRGRPSAGENILPGERSEPEILQHL